MRKNLTNFVRSYKQIGTLHNETNVIQAKKTFLLFTREFVFYSKYIARVLKKMLVLNFFFFYFARNIYSVGFVVSRAGKKFIIGLKSPNMISVVRPTTYSFLRNWRILVLNILPCGIIYHTLSRII